MSNKNQGNLIFLSYARNDARKVRDVYVRLSDAKVNVWMDTEDMPIGTEWEIEVQNVLRASQLVLVFLTHNSVTQDGFLQKEIRIALDIWREKAPGTIYLIPVRLENCPIHKALEKFHWVDIFEDSGWKKLLEQVKNSNDEVHLETVPSDIPKPVCQKPMNLYGLKKIPLVTFPEEVRRFILDCISHDEWEGISEDVQKFILSLGCKLEPIVQIVPATATPLVIGFECLGLGISGENFQEICDKCEHIDSGLLRICLAISAIRTISTLRVEATKNGVTGARNLIFSINLDPFMMDSKYFSKFLNWYYHDLEHNVIFEVNETTTKQYLTRLNTLQVDYNLRYSADDINNWHPDVRKALIDRVEMTKMDHLGFIEAMNLRGDDKSETIRRITNQNIPTKPLIVEGVEDDDYISFLQRNWDFETYGHLYGQGYTLDAGIHWSSTVQPLKGFELLGGSILLAPS